VGHQPGVAQADWARAPLHEGMAPRSSSQHPTHFNLHRAQPDALPGLGAAPVQTKMAAPGLMWPGSP
jgi:hypothetical protein